MNGVSLRPWAYEDILAVAALEKECFPDPWNYRMLADAFFAENTLTAAAEENGALVGYAFAVLAGETADIANVAVAPAARRRGAASALLRALEAGAAERGVRELFLEVRVSNAAAMALYLKCGYVGVYARKRYYGNGEDALVMHKIL